MATSVGHRGAPTITPDFHYSIFLSLTQESILWYNVEINSYFITNYGINRGKDNS